MRLASLKRTYGKTLAAFPPCFVRGATPRRILAHSRGFRPARDATLPSSRLYGGLLTQADATRAINTSFGNVRARDVRQRAGRTCDSAGKVLPDGLATMIIVLAPVTDNDVFLDIGACLGNIQALMALMTICRSCTSVLKCEASYAHLVNTAFKITSMLISIFRS